MASIVIVSIFLILFLCAVCFALGGVCALFGAKLTALGAVLIYCSLHWGWWGVFTFIGVVLVFVGIALLIAAIGFFMAAKEMPKIVEPKIDHIARMSPKKRERFFKDAKGEATGATKMGARAYTAFQEVFGDERGKARARRFNDFLSRLGT